MKVVRIIIGFITDPFRKVTSHINNEKITRYLSKHQIIIYGITAFLVVIMALTFYLWLK